MAGKNITTQMNYIVSSGTTSNLNSINPTEAVYPGAQRHHGNELPTLLHPLPLLLIATDSRWGQLPLSLKAKLNQTVLTWEFPALNMYLLVYAF